MQTTTARQRATAGSALIIVMISICVLSVVAGSLLLTNMARYHTTFQSASWQESIVASEAGVDLAMNELRKRVVNGPGSAFTNNWAAVDPRTGKAYASYGHAFPSNNLPFQIATHTGEGNSAMQVRVFVDVPGASLSPTANFAQANDNSFISQLDNPTLRDTDGVDRSHWLYRIRSLGIAGLTGPPRPNLSKSDNRLRRFSFFTDWRTGLAVDTPQVARLVEVIVRPETNFRNALMADKQIDLGHMDVLIDSYDSGKGAYSVANRGTMGNIATNGQLINANYATVEGNALTNNGQTTDAQNVTGQQSANFYQELPPVTAGSLNPAWSAVADGGTVTASRSFVASTDASNPTLVRLDGINLPDGGQVINLNPPTGTPAASPAYIKLYVQGDISTLGSSYINVAANVNAIFYFTGNVSLQGLGIINNSFLARQLMLNGIQPPASTDGTFPARSITIATSQDFEGILYAPSHDLKLALTAATSGGGGGNSGTSGMLTPQITALQNQINALNLAIANLQADYAQESAKYTHDGGNGHLQKMQQDQAQITNDQSQITTLTQQLQTLTTGLNPTSSADDHSRGYNGIYGAYVARTIAVAKKTHVHYDETLRTAGPVNHYEIIDWFEDNIGRDAAGGPEAFWWPGPR